MCHITELNNMLQNKEEIYSDVFEYIKSEKVEGFIPTGINEKRDRIKVIEEWISNNIDVLFEICTYYKKVKDYVELKKNEIEIIQGLAKTLTDFSPIPLKLAIVIIDIGINKFCKC